MRRSHEMAKRSGDVHLPEIEDELPVPSRRERPAFSTDEPVRGEVAVLVAPATRPFWRALPRYYAIGAGMLLALLLLRRTRTA
jgi:hypothetical protein